MRKMKVNSWIVGLIILFILAGFQANAQRERRSGDRNGYRSANPGNYGEGFGALNRMESILDLTEEQKTQIEKLQLDFQKESLPTFNKLNEKKVQLSTLITENADLVKIEKLIDEIGDLRVALDKLRVEMHFEKRELLTDDQKIKFDTHFGNLFAHGGRYFKPYGMHGHWLK